MEHSALSVCYLFPVGDLAGTNGATKGPESCEHRETAVEHKENTAALAGTEPQGRHAAAALQLSCLRRPASCKAGRS